MNYIILFAIFNIIAFNSILSKNLTPSDIFKGSQNKHMPTNSIPKIHSGFGTLFGKRNLGNNIKRNSFMACCVKAGLTSIKQIVKAYSWAVKNNYIIMNDIYGIKKYNDFAQKVSVEFGTTYHSKWKIKGSVKTGNFWVLNSKGKIIFDSTLIDKKIKRIEFNQMKIDLDILIH
jgi:hypothetical protein